MLSMVATVIDPNVAWAIWSISASAWPSARSTGVAACTAAGAAAAEVLEQPDHVQQRQPARRCR